MKLRQRGAEPEPEDLDQLRLDDAVDRARRLQQVTEALSEALTPQQVLEAVLTQGLRAAEARAGAIGLVTGDGDAIVIAAYRGYEASVMERWTRFPLASDVPMCRVVRTGEPLFLASVVERNAVFPELGDQGQEGHALVVLPLQVEGRIIGSMSLSFAQDISFPPERREMKITLARQAAQALARSRLYENERALRQRMSFLAEASELLASSLAYEETLARVARLAVPELADWCAIDVVTEDGRIERLTVAHDDPERERFARELQERYPPRDDDPHGVGYVLRTGTPELLPELTQELLDEALGEDEELRRIVSELGLRSSICVPLRARGRALGALTLVAAETHPRYTETDLELAVELARRAAVAVDNARLFREAEKGANAALALEHVADGVVLLDPDGVVRHWNHAVSRITGVDERTALGRPVEDAVPSWPTLTSQLVLVQPGEPRGRATTVPLTLAGEERWIAVSGVDFGHGTVYALRDVTDEHALEKTRSDFVATASHELRTPLAAVYGAVRTLRRDDIELSDEDRGAFLDMIETEAVRLVHIVDQILLAGQLDADALVLDVAPSDAVAVAESVLESASLHVPAGIALRLSGDGAPPVFCDENKLRQVLANLVDNAIKYSPGGGDVEIRIGAGDRAVRIAVVDEGLGIPSSELDRIFEKFYRLDPAQARGVGGSGLGLYICRELVERMNGRLRVESEAGRGSTFTIELPARPY